MMKPSGWVFFLEMEVFGKSGSKLWSLILNIIVHIELISLETFFFQSWTQSLKRCTWWNFATGLVSFFVHLWVGRLGFCKVVYLINQSHWQFVSRKYHLFYYQVWNFKEQFFLEIVTQTPFLRKVFRRCLFWIVRLGWPRVRLPSVWCVSTGVLRICTPRCSRTPLYLGDDSSWVWVFFLKKCGDLMGFHWLHWSEFFFLLHGFPMD